MGIFKTISSFLFSLFLAASPPVALAQNYDEDYVNENYGEPVLEKKLSRLEVNEITRRANFSRNEAPIVLIKVFDKDSRWQLNNVVVELKDGDESIRESYYVGKEISYYPYMAMTDNGAIFSIALGDERKINKLEVKCMGYDFYEADFPLSTLLNHINSPLSSRLPDSVAQDLEFKYDWNNAVVFRTNYDNTNEFIEKVSNLDIMNYSHYINGESFYSNYSSFVLNKEVPQLLNSYEEFHILVPIEVEIERTPQKIKIEE